MEVHMRSCGCPGCWPRRSGWLPCTCPAKTPCHPRLAPRLPPCRPPRGQPTEATELRQLRYHGETANDGLLHE
eukprot:15446416-Alexandrium_andersonii.AAC.1